LYYIIGNTAKANYWVGGTDIATETQWVWGIKEVPISGYENWCPSEPNDYHGQDCMILYGDCKLKWDDVSCDFLEAFICEKPFNE